MPRKHRIHYNSALYHVMNQGNFRQQLFYDEADYRYAYKLLEHVATSYQCKIHLFCLMTNHVHFLMEVDDIPLSKIMQSFSSSYSRYINKKKEHSGHRFRGRYKEKLVQSERYLLELCYYIHNNPCNAFMVENVDDYPWSSHHCYTGKQSYHWVSTGLITEILHKHIQLVDPYNALIRNREYVYDAPSFCQFDDEGKLTIGDSLHATLNASRSLDLTSFSIMQIINIICEYLDVPLFLIQSKNKKAKVQEAKSLIAYFAHYHGKFSLCYIADILCVGSDNLSKALQHKLSSVQKRDDFCQKIKVLRHEFLNIKLELEKDKKNGLVENGESRILSG